MTAVPMSDCITRLADSGPRGSGRAFEASLEACMRETATGFSAIGSEPQSVGTPTLRFAPLRCPKSSSASPPAGLQRAHNTRRYEHPFTGGPGPIGPRPSELSRRRDNFRFTAFSEVGPRPPRWRAVYPWLRRAPAHWALPGGRVLWRRGGPPEPGRRVRGRVLRSTRGFREIPSAGTGLPAGWCPCRVGGAGLPARRRCARKPAAPP
jgi:hypothetical protein